jgi:hypothetical protein
VREGRGGGSGWIFMSRCRTDDDDDNNADADADADADDSKRSMNSGRGGRVLLHSPCRLQATLCVTCDV